MNQYLFPFALTALCLSASPQRPIALEKPLPPITATAASGPWLERAALQPATYGKVRGVSPASSPEPLIVLFTPTLSESFFQLATAVDAVVEKHPELKWSFVQVLDTKGAQYGGYTATELATRLAEIKALADKHGIKHLSFLVAAPPARPGDTTITLASTKAAAPDAARSLVSWFAKTEASQLTKATISKLVEELSVTIGK